MNPAPPQLPISPRTVLVDTNFVRAARGVDADKVFSWVDSGALRWAWNVTANQNGGGARALRFWAREISHPTETATLTFEEVLAIILPPGRNAYASGVVEIMLQISWPQLARLRREITRKAAKTGPFPREGLAAFLRHRWIGGGNS